MKILFVNLSGLVFTVATPEQEPLGGTESALCYLARALAANGHDIAVVARLPDNRPVTRMGVRHVPHAALMKGDFLAAENFDVIIANNAPVAGSALRAMAPRARLLLWNHVTPDQKSIQDWKNPEAHTAFDGVVYVSEWQKRETENHFGIQKPGAVIGNGFAPAFANLFATAEELAAAKTCRAAYFTTPFRGLAVLLDALDGMSLPLDIFSSMNLYQIQRAHDPHTALYARAQAMKNVVFQPAVSQKELASKLKNAAFFTYPSIFAETFCIAALEARAAGLKVLTTDTGALRTQHPTASFITLDPHNPARLAPDFSTLMQQEIDRFQKDKTAWAEERFEDMRQVNRSCTWPNRATEWEAFLNQR